MAPTSMPLSRMITEAQVAQELQDYERPRKKPPDQPPNILEEKNGEGMRFPGAVNQLWAGPGPTTKVTHNNIPPVSSLIYTPPMCGLPLTPISRLNPDNPAPNSRPDFRRRIGLLTPMALTMPPPVTALVRGGNSPRMRHRPL